MNTGIQELASVSHLCAEERPRYEHGFAQLEAFPAARLLRHGSSLLDSLEKGGGLEGGRRRTPNHPQLSGRFGPF